MTWRDELRRVDFGGRRLIGASFRGASFFVEAAERVGGRRAVVHEFPLRDDPFVEDLGRRARSFRVDGYVLGDGYLAQRDSLIAALENTAGPGELVHPFHGVIRAICVSVSVRESRADGGVATFSIEFAETPAQAPTPTEVVDAVSSVSTSADAATAALDAEFMERYDPDNLPAFALASAEVALAKAVDGLASTLAPVVAEAQELAEFTGRLALLTTQASSLVRQPSVVIGRFRAAITGLVEAAARSPGAVMGALFDSYSTDLGPTVDAITTTRARELANQTAMVEALRRVIAVEAARLSPRASYISIEDATIARDQAAALLEEQAATAGDTAYPTLVELRSEVLRAVPGGLAFARVVTIARMVPVPSLLLTYQLYGSVDREDDVIARNAISHPGFVAGDLRVLSDV